MLKSVDEVVEAVGGNAAVASLAGVKASAVSNWKARGSIPAEYFLIFSGFLTANGKSFDPAVFGFNDVAEARP